MPVKEESCPDGAQYVVLLFVPPCEVVSRPVGRGRRDLEQEKEQEKVSGTYCGVD